MDQQRRMDFRNFHYAGAEGVLIPLLQEAQQAEGYISRARMDDIHRRSGIPLAHIYGVATFYAQFRLQPIGRHLVKVCHGTACHVAGARSISEALETELGVATGDTTEDGQYTLETVACLGCCSLAPVITVGTDTFGSLDPTLARRALRQHRRAAAAPAGGHAPAAAEAAADPAADTATGEAAEPAAEAAGTADR
jgi:NADH:ubiquinone oxidoreductase subunit E